MAEPIVDYGVEVGLCYWDGDSWEKVEDDSFALRANLYYWDGDSWEKLTSGTVGLDVGFYYWDGSAWQKVGKEQLLGFESVVGETVTDTNLDEGSDTLLGTAVASGKVQKITVAAFNYTGTAPTSLLLYANCSGITVVLKAEYSVTSGNWYTWTGEVYLEATDELGLDIDGSTAGDDARLRYGGVEMDAP